MESCTYDGHAESISLQWAKEAGITSYENRLRGIERDKLSFQNEQEHPQDAYWEGVYVHGVDGHGKPALTTSEVAIPGRVHRDDSHAMVDSMAGYAMYTLSRIEQGAMSHEQWDIAREQFHQFRALQDEILTLHEDESLVGFAMNGKTARDGVGMFYVTRNGDTFSYATRLIGGISEGAASDLLDQFVAHDALRVSLSAKTDNPLYAAVRGTIHLDLKDAVSVKQTVQHVLDKRNEQSIPIKIISSCKTKEVSQESHKKAIEPACTGYAFFQKRRVVERGENVHNQKTQEIPVDEKPNQEFVQTPVQISPWGIPVFTVELVKDEGHAKPNFVDHKKNNSDVEMKKVTAEMREIAHHEKGILNKIVLAKQNQVEKVQEYPLSKRYENATDKQKTILEAHTQMLFPIATGVLHTESSQGIMAYERVVTVKAHKVLPIIVEKPAGQCVLLEDWTISRVRRFSETDVESDQMVIKTVDVKTVQMQDMRETDTLYEIDALEVYAPAVATKVLEQQLERGIVSGVVTKIAWMEWRSENTYREIETVEMTQDMTATMHNLLHFLKKLVRKYLGEDRILQRQIAVVAADKKDSIEDDILYYEQLLSRYVHRARMFAYVN